MVSTFGADILSLLPTVIIEELVAAYGIAKEGICLGIGVIPGQKIIPARVVQILYLSVTAEVIKF